MVNRSMIKFVKLFQIIFKWLKKCSFEKRVYNFKSLWKQHIDYFNLDNSFLNFKLNKRSTLAASSSFMLSSSGKGFFLFFENRKFP